VERPANVPAGNEALIIADTGISDLVEGGRLRSHLLFFGNGLVAPYLVI
jgi:hypothetical protein